MKNKVGLKDLLAKSNRKIGKKKRKGLKAGSSVKQAVNPIVSSYPWAN